MEDEIDKDSGPSRQSSRRYPCDKFAKLLRHNASQTRTLPSPQNEAGPVSLARVCLADRRANTPGSPRPASTHLGFSRAAPYQTSLPDAGPEHATRTYVGCPPAPAEHAGKQHGHRETEFPSPALNANILSLEPLGKSPNWPTVRAGKWATTRQSALLGIPTDSRLSRRLVLSRHGPFSPRAPKGTLDRSRARTRLVSSRGAVTCGLPDFMMSFHHRTGPKYGLIQRRYGQIDAMRPVSNSIRCYQTAAGLYDADISRSRLMCHGGVLRVALSLSFSRGFWPIFGSRSQGEHWRRRKWRGQGEFGDFSANYSRFCGV